MAKERTMSPEEKMKRRIAALKRQVPAHKIRLFLMETLSEGVKRRSNSLSSDEHNLALREMASIQLKMGLGEIGTWTVTRKKDGSTYTKTGVIPWTKLAEDQRGDMIRALRQGKVLTFKSELETLLEGEEGEVEVTEDDNTDEDGDGEQPAF